MLSYSFINSHSEVIEGPLVFKLTGLSFPGYHCQNA